MEHGRIGSTLFVAIFGLLAACGGIDTDEAAAHVEDVLSGLTYTLSDADGEFDESIYEIVFDEATGVLILTIDTDFELYNMDVPVRSVSVYYDGSDVGVVATDGRVLHQLRLICDAGNACIESGDPIARALLPDEETHFADDILYCPADSCAALVRDFEALGARIATEAPRTDRPGIDEAGDSESGDEQYDACEEGAVGTASGTIGSIAPDGAGAVITPRGPVTGNCSAIRMIRIEGSHPECVAGAEFNAIGEMIRSGDSPAFAAAILSCKTIGEPEPAARVPPSRAGFGAARLVGWITDEIDRSRTWIRRRFGASRQAAGSPSFSSAAIAHPASRVRTARVPSRADSSPCPDATQCNRLVIDFVSLLDLVAAANPRTR